MAYDNYIAYNYTLFCVFLWFKNYSYWGFQTNLLHPQFVPRHWSNHRFRGRWCFPRPSLGELGGISAHILPSGSVNSLLLKMVIEIVDLPMNSMLIFHSYASLPEGNVRWFINDTKSIYIYIWHIYIISCIYINKYTTTPIYWS